jgi:hypothetical protein
MSANGTQRPTFADCFAEFDRLSFRPAKSSMREVNAESGIDWLSATGKIERK